MTLTARQSGSAARADSTAAFRSSAEERGTRASTSPVAGLVTGNVSAEVAGVQAPPT
jgi:hypothetical protein